MKRTTKLVKIGRYTLELSNESKRLFPLSGLSKGDLISYYQRIADHMLPFIKNRPVTMHRFPDGIDKEGFYQKDIGDDVPSFLVTQPVERSDGSVLTYPVINNVASLVYIANLACITPHIWQSRIDKLNYPDRIIFDLDPAKGVSFSEIAWTAVQLKQALEAHKLHPFVMTTGSRGVHVVVPIRRSYLFDEVRNFANQVGQGLVEQYPKKLTMNIRKEKRGQRIFIDTLRNSWSATAVVPYAVRALPGAPIATPISWQELVHKDMSPQKYTMKNIFRRISRGKDPWHDMHKMVMSLPIHRS